MLQPPSVSEVVKTGCRQLVLPAGGLAAGLAVACGLACPCLTRAAVAAGAPMADAAEVLVAALDGAVPDAVLAGPATACGSSAPACFSPMTPATPQQSSTATPMATYISGLRTASRYNQPRKPVREPSHSGQRASDPNELKVLISNNAYSPGFAPGAALRPAWAVCWSRVYTGGHYPSDVLAGAAIGIGSAVVVARIVPVQRCTDEPKAASVA